MRHLSLALHESMQRIYGYIGLWKIALLRLAHDAVLTLCLLLGWILVVALTAALPMYTDAVNRSLLRQELEGAQLQSRPAFAFFYHFVGGSSAASWENYQALNTYMSTGIAGELGLPVKARMHYVKSDLFQIFPVVGGSYNLRDQPMLRGYLGFVQALAEHITVLEGVPPGVASQSEDPAAPLDVWVTQELATKSGLQVGEELILFDPSTYASTTARRRLEIPVRIAGIWAPKDNDPDFWYLSPAALSNVLLVPEATYISRVSTLVPHAFFDLGWYHVFNGDRVRAEDVPEFLRQVTRVNNQVSAVLPGTYLELSPVSALQRYQLVASAQAILLLFFGLPILGLILYFIVLIADSTVKRQQTEIAILKSRGATAGQIFFIFLLQGLGIGVIALLCGPYCGRLIAQAIGSTHYFLTFHAGLPLDAVITAGSLRFALLALAAALLATVLPAVGAARLTIVAAKRESSRAQRRPFWRRTYLDLLLLAISGYGYYLLKTQGRIAFLRPGSSGDPFFNPLLFLTPVLFILAAALFCVRIFPQAIQLLSRLWRPLGGVALLLALYNLARTSRAYTNLLLLLILTTSLGTFTASMARTLDVNLEARTFYQVGADVALTEGVAIRTGEASASNPTADAASSEIDQPTLWISLPVDDHRRAPGVRAATRIGRFEVSAQVGSQLIPGILYGIDRASFPQVAYFRRDFAAQSLGALMNELALEYAGVIVSRSLLEQLHLTRGDTLLLRGLIPTSNAAVPFTIVGEMALFPTAYLENGAFFVANLDYIFEQLGQELPYKVWLATDAEVETATLTAALDELGYKVLAVEDARSQLAQARRQPDRVGVFGFLSVGFIATTVLSMLALTIFAVLSFRQRFIQLGILRALGLSTRQLAISLGGEQFLITATGICAGTYLGLLSSYLFIPFLQIGYSQADLVPPFIVQIAWGEVAVIVAALVAMLLVATVSVIWLLMRMRTFQAVKLGEALA